MLTSPASRATYISAADLGTARDQAMRNRTQQGVVVEEGGDAVSAEEEEEALVAYSEEEAYFCDSPRKFNE